MPWLRIPVSHSVVFSSIIQETAQDVRASNVVGPCFGHAGDGNWHCIMPVCEQDYDTGHFGVLLQVQDRLMQRTIAVGGTVTGEHGVGYGKIPLLQRQYGDGTVEMLRRVKAAFDPHSIMNPGKIVHVPGN